MKSFRFEYDGEANQCDQGKRIEDGHKVKLDTEEVGKKFLKIRYWKRHRLLSIGSEWEWTSRQYVRGIQQNQVCTY